MFLKTESSCANYQNTGTFDKNCDQKRENSDIRGVLKKFGKDDVLKDMDTYWKDYNGNDDTFWEHEWNKHGTCVVSTLQYHIDI